MSSGLVLDPRIKWVRPLPAHLLRCTAPLHQPPEQNRRSVSTRTTTSAICSAYAQVSPPASASRCFFVSLCRRAAARAGLRVLRHFAQVRPPLNPSHPSQQHWHLPSHTP
jgi:hypothetical protein